MTKKITENYIYEIDTETFVLKVWHKLDPEGSPHFLEQPFNPETGENFISVSDAETFFINQYGEAAIEE